MTRVVVVVVAWVVGGDKTKIKTSKENSALEFLYTVCGFGGAIIGTHIVSRESVALVWAFYFLADTPPSPALTMLSCFSIVI